MALPIRVHDLLLGFAGRIDDDALADARELLASAELDRSLEFLVGCLVAGRIAITSAQRTELDSLFHQVYLDSTVLTRVIVDESAAIVRHRFGGGAINGEPAGHGVAEAARRVLDVLPDVRSVWAVWRLTPSGAVTGPVPHRVVLVGVGPAGFAPATAYRLENALRRAGIRASVEVLRDGTDAPDYHHAAMQYASQVPFSRQAPTNPAPVRARAAAPSIAPPPAAPPPAAAARPDFAAPGRRSRLEQTPEPPALPATVSAPEPPAPAPAPPGPAPDISDTAQMARQSRREAPDDPLASANPPVRPPQPAPPGTSWLTALPESTSSKPPHTNGSSAPNPGDDALSDQEKHLLRQLQEELARREQEESEQSGTRAIEGHGRHGSQPGQFDWPNQNGSPMIINGVPPQHPDQRR
jgi:hypothetical protein